MKLKAIIKKIGKGIIKEVVPGGGLFLAAVNEFLPEESKLTSSSTGEDLARAAENLPPSIEEKLLEMEFDLDKTWMVESHDSNRTMLVQDAINPHSTRPYIIKHSFHLVAGISLLVIFTWMGCIIAGKETLVTTVQNGWPFVAAILAPFITLMMAYFGVLRREHKDKLDASNGIQTEQPTNIIPFLNKKVA